MPKDLGQLKRNAPLSWGLAALSLGAAWIVVAYLLSFLWAWDYSQNASYLLGVSIGLPHLIFGLGIASALRRDFALHATLWPSSLIGTVWVARSLHMVEGPLGMATAMCLGGTFAAVLICVAHRLSIRRTALISLATGFLFAAGTLLAVLIGYLLANYFGRLGFLVGAGVLGLCVGGLQFEVFSAPFAGRSDLRSAPT